MGVHDLKGRTPTRIHMAVRTILTYQIYSNIPEIQYMLYLPIIWLIKELLPPLENHGLFFPSDPRPSLYCQDLADWNVTT
jgi:hypothetical protein